MDCPPPSSSRLKPADYVLAGLSVVVILLFYAFLPLFKVVTDCSALYVLAKSWNAETGWEHGWFIVPAVIGIVAKNWTKIKQEPIVPSSMGLVLIALALALYVGSVRTHLWRIAIGALPILIYGVIVYLWGWKRAGYFLFPLGLFYFCLPLPGVIQATNSLQLFVTKCAAKLAMLCGVVIDVTGNKVFLLGKGDFDVDEGCSGIRSLMALLLIAFVYGYFIHPERWKRGVIFLSAIPLAIVANILRIFSILIVADKISVDFAQTIYHDKVGFFSFAIALGLLLLLSKLLATGLKRGPRTITKKASHSPLDQVKP